MTFDRLRFLAKRTLLAVVLLTLAWGAGLIWFARTIPRDNAADPHPTDVVVVLTGGSERLTTGLDLLARGLGGKLFVSGVHQNVDLDDLLRTVQLPERAVDGVVLGHQAGNTIGNAAETAAWMRAEGYRSLRLVTANYHMRRSLLEFRMAFPEAEIVPHPVAPESVRLDEWWRRPGTLTLIVGEYLKYQVAALRFALFRVFGV